MEKNTINHLTWFANNVAPAIFDSSLDDQTKIKLATESANKFYASLRKPSNFVHVDLHKLDYNQAIELRFKPWSSDNDIDEEISYAKSQLKPNQTLEDIKHEIDRLENQRNLMLIPAWYVPLIPDGTILISIAGDNIEFKVNNDGSYNIDLDTREGCIAFGIKIPKSTEHDTVNSVNSEDSNKE